MQNFMLIPKNIGPEILRLSVFWVTRFAWYSIAIFHKFWSQILKLGISLLVCNIMPKQALFIH